MSTELNTNRDIMRFKFLHIGLVFGLATLLFSCNKDTNYGPDPYAGGMETLNIKFADETPSPSQARVGSEMTFKVYGLSKYDGSMKFYMNETEAEVLAITDSTVTAKLPIGVSTGNVKVVVANQIFSGPVFKVIGKTNIDPTFASGAGTDGPIYAIHQLSNTNLILTGSFSDYNGAGISSEIGSIIRITSNGELVRMNNSGGARSGISSGAINTLAQTSDGRLVIAGQFDTYGGTKLTKNMTTINADGSLYTKSVEILNTTEDPANSYMTVPLFNGGANRSINKLFYQGDKIYALGGFSGYASNFYVRSTADNILSDVFPMSGLIRMNMDGSLDSTYFVNMTSFPRKGYEGANGTINDGQLTTDNKMVLVGAFSRFNGTSVSSGIVRLNESGVVDNTFNAGSGADDAIQSIARSNGSGFFLTGLFRNYNGSAANGLVLINEDGFVNTSFKAKAFSGGRPTFVKQLSNGLIIVCGTFEKYDNIIREGVVILNSDGTIATDYNNIGKLTGSIFTAYESRNNLGMTTVILGGWISSFSGNNNIGNIVRITLQH